MGRIREIITNPNMLTLLSAGFTITGIMEMRRKGYRIIDIIKGSLGSSAVSFLIGVVMAEIVRRRLE